MGYLALALNLQKTHISNGNCSVSKPDKRSAGLDDLPHPSRQSHLEKSKSFLGMDESYTPQDQDQDNELGQWIQQNQLLFMSNQNYNCLEQI